MSAKVRRGARRAVLGVCTRVATVVVGVSAAAVPEADGRLLRRYLYLTQQVAGLRSRAALGNQSYTPVAGGGESRLPLGAAAAL